MFDTVWVTERDLFGIGKILHGLLDVQPVLILYESLDVQPILILIVWVTRCAEHIDIVLVTQCAADIDIVTLLDVQHILILYGYLMLAVMGYLMFSPY